ncbi:hypothetical protein [Klebsiella michiganensis]|uniref:hypothetical protein n=1 Tax=Klebsiella michiganensis TaxID=1134687 RepID=UPI003AB88B3E
MPQRTARRIKHHLALRIGMRLLMGYFLIVAIAAWFVLSIFVQEIKPGVRRATEGTLIDTATLLAELAREDLLSADPQHGRLAQAFQTLHRQPINANIAGINKVRNEYHVYMTDAHQKPPRLYPMPRCVLMGEMSGFTSRSLARSVLI